MARNPLNSGMRFLRKGRAPLTYGLIAAAIIGFFFAAGAKSPEAVSAVDAFIFNPASWFSRPWTLLSYAFFTFDMAALVGICVGLYFFAAGLEQSWGTRRYAWALAAATVIAALSFWLYYLVSGVAVPLYSMLMPVSCAVIAWAARTRHAIVLLFAVLPVPAWAAAALFAGATLLYYASPAPWVLPFAAVPFLVSYAYAGGRFGLPVMPGRGRRPSRERDYRGPDYDKRLQAEYERRKLKELLERSLDDDSTPGPENR